MAISSSFDRHWAMRELRQRLPLGKVAPRGGYTGGPTAGPFGMMSSMQQNSGSMKNLLDALYGGQNKKKKKPIGDGSGYITKDRKKYSTKKNGIVPFVGEHWTDF